MNTIIIMEFFSSLAEGHHSYSCLSLNKVVFLQFS